MWFVGVCCNVCVAWCLLIVLCRLAFWLWFDCGVLMFLVVFCVWYAGWWVMFVVRWLFAVGRRCLLLIDVCLVRV